MVRIDWITDGTDERVRAATDLLAGWEREDLDQRRTTPVDEVAQSIWSHPSGLTSRVAVAESADRIVGAAHLGLDPANPHLAWIRWLVVDASNRRRGVGRALVAALQAAARSEGRPQLGHAALANSDLVEGFGSAIGAQPGLVLEQNRLPTADVPPGLPEGWVDRTSQRAGGSSLVSFNDECPEEYVEGV